MKAAGDKRIKVGKVSGLWLNNGRKELLRRALHRSHHSD